MNSNNKRYILAVYLFLSALAIIFGLLGIGFYNESEALQGIFLNLATEIAGFVILFFIVERLFLINQDQNFAEQIALIRQEIQTKFRPLSWETSQNRHLNLLEHLSSSSEIFLLGYSLTGLLNTIRGELPGAICKGTKCKILIINPDSEAHKLLENASTKSENVIAAAEKSLEYINDIERHIKDKCNKPKGEFEAKLISWIPSCTLIIAKEKKQMGKASIFFNSLFYNMPPGIPRKRLSLNLNEIGDEEEFVYFMDQFNRLWKSNLATEIQRHNRPSLPDHTILADQGESEG